MRASEIAYCLGGRFLGDDREICGIERISESLASDLSFVIWPKDIGFAKKTLAGCLVAPLGVAADIADEISSSLIAVDDLVMAMKEVRDLKDQGKFGVSPLVHLDGPVIADDAKVHQTAIVGKSQISSGVVLGPHVVIGDHVFIGAETTVLSGAVIADGTFIGDYCHIGANSVIGADGFVPFGESSSKNLLSLGNVRIFNRVRVGALCTIDRGLIGTTMIGDDTLLDNAVHVGHDVVIKDNVVVAAQTGFAGNVCVDSFVTIGGQVGVAPHVHIKTGARISGKSMVHCDISPYEIWSGNPSVPHGAYLRAYGRAMNSFKGRYGNKRDSN